MEDEKGTYFMRCSKEFKELVEDYIKRWEEKFGFALSCPQVTANITKKIVTSGGLKI